MEQRGRGTILVTSATAAMRGNKGQHSHAAAMAARRMLCQSLNAEFGPKGIHVVHIIVDGMVDAPDTLGRMLGADGFQRLREERGLEKDGLLLPAEIADTYFPPRAAAPLRLDAGAGSAALRRQAVVERLASRADPPGLA